MKVYRSLTIAILFLALTLSAAAAFAVPAGVVNINQADLSQLVLLPRVGPALATRIVEYREANGKFERVEDLMLVRGIGEKTYQLMKPFLAINGETTLKEKVKPSQLSPADPDEKQEKQ